MWRWQRNALRWSCPDLRREQGLRVRAAHEIEGRTGVAAMRHIIDGCDDAMAQGWDEAACVCLTHAFPVQDIEADIGRKDITPEQYRFIEG